MRATTFGQGCTRPARRRFREIGPARLVCNQNSPGRAVSTATRKRSTPGPIRTRWPNLRAVSISDECLPSVYPQWCVPEQAAIAARSGSRALGGTRRTCWAGRTLRLARCASRPSCYGDFRASRLAQICSRFAPRRLTLRGQSGARGIKTMPCTPRTCRPPTESTVTVRPQMEGSRCE
jgi:hypothetical protein